MRRDQTYDHDSQCGTEQGYGEGVDARRRESNESTILGWLLWTGKDGHYRKGGFMWKVGLV